MLLPDLLNPLDALIGRLRHGPMHRFTFSAKGDFTMGDIDHLLRRYHIRIWGREVEPDAPERAFLVKQAQAGWAEYVLCRAGVPLTSEFIDQRNAGYVQRHEAGSVPNPWTRGSGPRSLTDYAADAMRALAGRSDQPLPTSPRATRPRQGGKRKPVKRKPTRNPKATRRLWHAFNSE